MYKFTKDTKHDEMRKISEEKIAQMTVEEKATFWEKLTRQWHSKYVTYSNQYFKASRELDDVEEERKKWKIVAMSLGASEDAIDDVELEVNNDY